MAAAIVISLIAPATFHAAPDSQSPPAALPDVRTLGAQVGDRIRTFTLSDQYGQPRTLDSLMGPKGLMLVFFRSADW